MMPAIPIFYEKILGSLSLFAQMHTKSFSAYKSFAMPTSTGSAFPQLQISQYC